VAASLPLLVGGMAIVGTFAALKLVNGVTDVSVFALNLTTGLGLGLAIDPRALEQKEVPPDRDADDDQQQRPEAPCLSCGVRRNELGLNGQRHDAGGHEGHAPEDEAAIHLHCSIAPLGNHTIAPIRERRKGRNDGSAADS